MSSPSTNEAVPVAPPSPARTPASTSAHTGQGGCTHCPSSLVNPSVHQQSDISGRRGSLDVNFGEEGDPAKYSTITMCVKIEPQGKTASKILEHFPRALQRRVVNDRGVTKERGFVFEPKFQDSSLVNASTKATTVRYLVLGLALALYHLVSDQLDESMYLDVTVIYQTRES
ncbi:hypothetical protein QFC20_004848 [Naganishia adeliensis]|uniref:Uncharacterized protein n=1 Tax=Naganishia adeliensis TaxID=92952 RepID=A0ACC2VVE5_9TREE|nr:hypothetical protein QFC20_004848 [Naganishia adeliensis]